ncbi:hypothetical protein BXP70_05690 [Hymenobacter crusticola]|uniref:TonB-dependent receptor plug domain-containing protein n=2 Tax=Hymenobacter crusticola TaxID=1770526 RepID=A0A243WIK1_9BACT|nr:hypothetical protein BXP70_05690 [Hymenobacter crusticola]
MPSKPVSANVSVNQDITVTGRVLDDKGEGLPGVNVVVKGTTNGTQTGGDGSYTLTAPDQGILVFSFVGFNPQEVAIAGRTTVNVNLAPDTKTLNEVVVVGYGTQAKSEVTGAIASVKGEELVNQASQNPVSSLQGRVAGLQITNSGAPGTSPDVRIRGIGSIAGSAPLYVVDGTFVPDLSFVNQDDIASIEVLKDAASASIYGVRAANGVIIVTTKRGKQGTPRINYNGFVGVQKVTNQVEMANAQQYATLINEKNGPNSLATSLPSTDWLKQTTQPATIHNHQLSLSGGSDKISYSFSGSYLNQEGLIKKNNFERITARLQTDFNATEHIKLGYSAIFANTNSRDIPSDIFYQAFIAPPVLQPFLPNGRYGDPNLIGSGLGNFSNPQGSLDYYNQKTNGQTLVSNVFASFNILKDFTFRTSVGINYASTKFYNYRKADSLTTAQVYRGNTLRKGFGRSSTLQWENTLTYDKTVGDHHITALLGNTALRTRVEQVIGSINGVPPGSDANYYFNLGTVGTSNLENPVDLFTLASYFGRVNYAYKDRYLLTASFRRDGSSKFSKRWGNFPSVGAGWVLSEESFLKENGIFDFLKLRVSYGLLGNDQVVNNIAIQRASFLAGYTSFFGGQANTGASIDTQVPPNLAWEKVREGDAGLEMRFLNNRLTAEVDYYDRRTIDAVFPIPVLTSPGYTNAGGFYANNASFKNSGVEVAVRWAADAGTDFSYSVGFTGGYNQNKVLSTAGGDAPLFAGGLPVGGYLTTVSRVGAPIGSFYGYQVQGIFQSEQDVARSAQTDAKAGDFQYRDQNGDGVIDDRDKVIIGNPNPKFSYGLNTNFRYKAVDLQVDFQGVGGVDIYNATRGVRYGNENYTEEFYNKRWHGAGTSNTYPSANLTGRNLDPSDFYVEKGDYVRLRNIQLGYNLPKTLFGEKARIQGIRIYANAQNLFTLTNYSGFTPEVGTSYDPTRRPYSAANPTGYVTATGSNSGTNPTSSGIDLNVYPLSVTYNFGVNVSF